MIYLLKIVNKDVKFIFLIILLGIANSAFYSLLLICINRGIGHPSSVFMGLTLNGYVFFVLIVLSFFLRKIFQKHMVVLTNNILYDFELSIIKKIKDAEFEKFRTWDQNKVYTAMADIKVVSQLPRLFIDCTNYIVIILVSLVYLTYVSGIEALIVIMFSIALLVVFYYRQQTAVTLIQKARDLENTFYSYLEDFLSGFKEMKVSSQRTENIFSNYLSLNRRSARDFEKKAAVVYMDNELFSSYGWFTILGAIVFVIPQFQLGSVLVTTSFIVILLYLLGPLSTLITAIPFVTRVGVSLKRLETFHAELHNDFEFVETGLPRKAQYNFKELEFRNIKYQYAFKNQNTFKLGPVNLKIKKGEVVFIAGNNGSGKSTFLHILTGLIAPAEGAVFLNGKAINPDDRIAYRDRFSAVFIESFLFSENYNQFDLDLKNPMLEEYFDLLMLDTDILTSNGIAGKTLSKGQQKRLALIFALMEEKEILVLDEWAAEQDPYFRKYFYENILKVLKENGKTVIAVTHDDKYFKCADRIINFENGLVSSEFSNERFQYEF
jgi:cyclic peptide transporter